MASEEDLALGQRIYKISLAISKGMECLAKQGGLTAAPTQLQQSAPPSSPQTKGQLTLGPSSIATPSRPQTRSQLTLAPPAPTKPTNKLGRELTPEMLNKRRLRAAAKGLTGGGRRTRRNR